MSAASCDNSRVVTGPQLDKVPVYPHAEQVQSGVRTDQFGIKEYYIKFVTSDSRADVRAFYMDAMPKDKWRFMDNEKPKLLNFIYSDYEASKDKKCVETYFSNTVFDTTTGGKTTVDITSYEYCRPDY